MPNIRNFLDLSTMHLSKDARDLLDELCVNASFGYFVWAPTDAPIPGTDQPNDEARPEHWPPDLWRVMAYARANGCDYILFDADAEIDPALPTFDDEREG